MATSKTKTISEQERLSKPSFPLPRYPNGTRVQVYMGAGWATGAVVHSQQDSCSVRLAIGNKLITVRDARSIRQAAQSS